jgi:hypothetical protein
VCKVDICARKGWLEYGNPEHHTLKQMMDILTGGRKEGNADGDAVQMWRGGRDAARSGLALAEPESRSVVASRIGQSVSKRGCVN